MPTEKAVSCGEETALLKSGSPCATLFITVLFLPQLTENLQYQRVIKYQAVPGEAEVVSRYISLTIGRHKGLVCTKPG